MRYLLSLGLLLSAFAAFAGAVRYEISPVFSQNEAPRLRVRILLYGETDGSTEFALPNEFGPSGQLFDCIRNFRCSTRACTLLVNRDAHMAVVQHPANAQIELLYEVVQDVPGSEVTQETAFRPLILPDFFHILGGALFITPMLGDGSCEVTLEWRGFPDNWLIHNSYGTQERTQHFQFSKTRMIESVFMGGDFRVLKTDVNGRPVYLAIRGHDWSFKDEDLLDMLQKTVATQRAFWMDWDIPYYTVTLLPMAPRPAMSGGQGFSSVEYLGTGLRNSFAAFVTPSPRLAVADIRHLFNHEMMHNWIGNKIRSGGGPNDMRFGWFSEGFTEYFALKNMLAGGFIDADEYVETLNDDFFDRLYTSGIGEEPNDVVAAGFFSDQSKAELPYKRGFVFAFFLDNAIRNNSGGQKNLHDFMLDLLEYYSARSRDLSQNFDFFEEKLTEYLNQDAAPFIQKYIREGKRIAPESFALPKYWKMEIDESGTPRVRLDKTVAGWEEAVRK